MDAKMKSITLLFCLFLLSSNAHAWRESHGGDSIAADFIGRTNDLVRPIDNGHRINPLFPDIRDNILVVSEDRIYDNKGKEILVFTACQKNDQSKPPSCTITINRFLYLALEKDTSENSRGNKEAIILDEFVKIISFGSGELQNAKDGMTVEKVTGPLFNSDDVVAEFVQVANIMLRDLELIPDPKINSIFQRILSVLPSTQYIARPSVFLGNVEKDAVNTCPAFPTAFDPCAILISAPRWAQYDAQYTDQALRKREQLILHEFLGIIKENDHDYMVSEQIINRLENFRKSR